MTTENIKTCPVCGNESFTLFITTHDFTITKEEFHLQKCTRCNLIATSPRPGPDAIGKYYASDNYISHTGKSKTIFDKVYLSARNLTLRWKHQLISQYYPEPKKILDYGCGTGEFLNYLQNKKWLVSGVEPNDKARQKANTLTGDKVTPELESYENRSFDVITLWHVLEHIHDLTNTIQKLKSRLTKNGLLIIAVPNPKSHDCQHYKNYWAGFDAPRHLWHFTKDTMDLLLQNNGFKIMEIKPMKLDSYYVSLLSEKYKNPNQLKLITGFLAFREGLASNISAKKTTEYSSLIYITKEA